jgi:hypothetical protein
MRRPSPLPFPPYRATWGRARWTPSGWWQPTLLALLSRYTGGLTDRYGPRLPLVAEGHPTRHRRRGGFVLFVVPWIWGYHWTTFFPATVVVELGLSILVPAVTTVALNSVDVRHTGLASAINDDVVNWPSPRDATRPLDDRGGVPSTVHREGGSTVTAARAGAMEG